MIDQNTIDKINNAVNIVDVISDFQEVKKSGTNYLALCPFHADKNLGSFIISPRKNMCNCFACEHGGDAIYYLMEAQHMSYPDALRWLGRKYNIEVEGSEKFRDVKPAKPREFQPAEDLPVMELPLRMYERSTKGLQNDVFVKWLYRHNWDSTQRARIGGVLKAYLVGTANTEQNEQFTVFWYMDEFGHLCTGKMIRYKYNGKRMKKEDGISHPTDWIHAWLFRSERCPSYDRDKMDWKRTYFGMHLVDEFPNADICIVESEKTAIVMSVAYGAPESRLWLACGSKTNLTRDRLRPLIDRKRRIILYPDRDAVDDWKDVANVIGYSRMTVNSDPVRKWWMMQDGEKADIADVVLRMTDGHDPYQMIEDSPVVKNLMEQLDLQIIDRQ